MKSGIIIFRDIKLNVNAYMQTWNNGTVVLHYVTPTNTLSFKTRSPKSRPTYKKQVVDPRHQNQPGQSVAKPVTRIYRESKHDLNKSEGNMFNAIFKDSVQGQRHPGRCVVAEPKLLSFRKPKYVGKMNSYGYKNLKNRRNHHDWITCYQRFNKRNT